MAFKFDPVIKKARFAVPGYSPQQMAEMGQAFINQAIRPRIQKGLDVNDAPAPALAPRYAKRKLRQKRNPIRDWTLSGLTLSTLSVLQAGHNTATIGFVGPIANRRASMNNRECRQFGISPSDSRALDRIRRSMDSPVKVIAA